MSGAGRALCIGVEADAENDARTFASIARSSGFTEPLLLLGAEATCSAVRAALRELASASRPGDLALLSFSGHGGRKRLDVPGEDLEFVEIWQLYDGALTERQVREDLAGFGPDVRVLVLSDNCNGGVPAAPSRSPAPPLAAAVMVLAASQPHQYADGPGLPGHFAHAVRRVWDGGAFRGSYARFFRSLWLDMPGYQKPDFYSVGLASFEGERPFSI